MRTVPRTPPPASRTQRTLAIAAVSLAALTTLAGCGSSSHPTKTAAAQTTADAATMKAKPAPVFYAPLTGLRVKSIAKRPALVVKIENSIDARPQTGINKADIVTEELVEGGITRFAAIFQSTNPGVVGPVRSVRNVDADIASPLHGLFAYSGGAGPVLRLMARTPVQKMTESYPGAAWYRSYSRVAPHNLYAHAAILWAHADKTHRKPPAMYLPFARSAAGASTATSDKASRPATALHLTFSWSETPNWAYDAATKRYLRSEGRTPSRTTSGARMTADNVIILRVTTYDAGYRDPAGNYVPATKLTGSGQATIVSDGRQVTGTWHKASQDALLTFRLPDGSPLKIAPGNSWIELVPNTGSVRIS